MTIVGDFLHWLSDGPHRENDNKRDYGLQTEGGEHVHYEAELGYFRHTWEIMMPEHWGDADEYALLKSFVLWFRSKGFVIVKDFERGTCVRVSDNEYPDILSDFLTMHEKRGLNKEEGAELVHRIKAVVKDPWRVKG